MRLLSGAGPVSVRLRGSQTARDNPHTTHRQIFHAAVVTPPDEKTANPRTSAAQLR